MDRDCGERPFFLAIIFFISTSEKRRICSFNSKDDNGLTPERVATDPRFEATK